MSQIGLDIRQMILISHGTVYLPVGVVQIVEAVGFRGMECGIYRGKAGTVDRGRWQTLVLIGIIRRVDDFYIVGRDRRPPASRRGRAGP